MFRKLLQRLHLSDSVEKQVSEELEFHCEMLTEDFRDQGLSVEEATNAAARRFGDVDQVHSQCVRISARSRPHIQALKLLLLLFFIAGLSLRVSGLDFQFHHLGNVLMATGVLGRLLLHVQNMKPTQGSLPLSLFGRRNRRSIESFDQDGRTPVERVIDKS